jgi:hypothetical protein
VLRGPRAQMSAATDQKVTAPAASPPAMKALRTQWMDRLIPALHGSGLLSDLVGMIAEYAAVYPLMERVGSRRSRAAVRPIRWGRVQPYYGRRRRGLEATGPSEGRRLAEREL